MWCIYISCMSTESGVWLNISSGSPLNLLLAERVYLAQSTNHICCFDIEKSFKARSKLNRKASSGMNNICGSHVSWFSLLRFMNIHEGDHWMKEEVLRVKVGQSRAAFWVFYVQKLKSLSLSFSGTLMPGQGKTALLTFLPFLSLVKYIWGPP